MLDIKIKTIPHNKHLYETCGDYWTTKEGTVEFRISDLKDYRYEILVAIHEIIERYLCKARNIPEDEIDAFDMAFEEARESGILADKWINDEPGNHPDAPYTREHKFATKIERMIARELNVNWKKYERSIEEL